MFRSADIVNLLTPAIAGPGSAAPRRPKKSTALLALAGASCLLVACAQTGQTLGKNTQPTKTTKPAVVTGTVKNVPPTVAQKPDQLVGLRSEDLRAALGAPARIREEDLARIYQYIGGDCVLDLFLYQAEGQAEGTYRVTYAEARSVKAEQKPVEACLKSLPSPVVAANTQPST